MRPRRQLSVSFYVDPLSMRVGQWNVGGWSLDGNPVVLAATPLPFELTIAELLPEVEPYVRSVNRTYWPADVIPVCQRRVAPTDQLELFSSGS